MRHAVGTQKVSAPSIVGVMTTGGGASGRRPGGLGEREAGMVGEAQAGHSKL